MQQTNVNKHTSHNMHSVFVASAFSERKSCKGGRFRFLFGGEKEIIDSCRED